LEHGCTFTPHKIITSEAIRAAHYLVLQWALSHGYAFPSHAIHDTILSGRLDLLIYMVVEQRMQIHDVHLEDIARAGQVHMLAWIWIQMQKSNPITSHLTFRYQIFETATLHGHLQILQWAHEQQIAEDILDYPKMWQLSIIYGHLHILKWIWSITSTIYSGHCYAIPAMNGNLIMLTWLHQVDPGFADHCCIISMQATKQRHLNILHWMHKNKLPMTEIAQKTMIKLQSNPRICNYHYTTWT
jgi:hypothetical protein